MEIDLIQGVHLSIEHKDNKKNIDLDLFFHEKILEIEIDEKGPYFSSKISITFDDFEKIMDEYNNFKKSLTIKE